MFTSVEKQVINEKDEALAEAEQEIEVARDGQQRMMKQLDINLSEMQASLESVFPCSSGIKSS